MGSLEAKSLKELITFRYLTFNVACNFMHYSPEYVKKVSQPATLTDTIGECILPFPLDLTLYFSKVGHSNID